MVALLALLSSLLWGSADFVGGLVARRRPAFAVVAWSQACALVIIVVWCVVSAAYDAPVGYLPWAAAAGVIGTLALAAFYSALATGTMGVVAPIAASGAILPVLIGLATGDAPSALQLLGMAVAIIGIVLASGPELRGGAVGGARAVGLAAAAAVGFGLVLWMIGEGAAYSVSMTLLTQRVASVTLAVLVAVVVRSMGGVTRSDLPVLAAVGFGDAAANAAYAVASTLGLLSVVAVLGSLYPVVTVLLARFVLHERLQRIQKVGVSVALAGVVLLGAG